MNNDMQFSESRFLVDLDGTLIRGEEVLPGAVEFCERYHDKLAIVSNNSTHSAVSLSTQLKDVGLNIAAERIILAGEYSLKFIKENYGDVKVFLVSNPAMYSLALEVGVDVVSDGADIVLVCRDTSLSYEKLSQASALVVNGATLIGANPDLSHPGKNGVPVPETGSIVKAIEACSGKEVTRFVGKPGVYLFEQAIDRFKWQRSDMVVIGDNVNTDISGASILGLRSFLVGSGEKVYAKNIRELLYKLPEKSFISF